MDLDQGIISLVALVRTASVHHLRHAVRHSSIGQNELNRALHEAAKLGRDDALEILLGAGADIYSTDVHGQNILLQAIIGGNLDIVKMLLDKNFLVSTRDSAKVSAALERKKEETSRVENLDVDAHYKFVPAPLHLAVATKNVDIVQLLITAGAEIEVEDLSGDTPIIAAAGWGNADIVTILVESNCDIDFKGFGGNTALISAAEKNNLQVLEQLITSGADMNSTNDCGDNALHVAAKEGNYEIINCLLNHGIDIDHTNVAGETALIKASQSSCIKSLEVLLISGADVNKQSLSHQTPISCAAEAGNEDMISLLLKNQAQPKLPGKDGMTAVHWCCVHGFLGSLEMMLEKEPLDFNMMPLSMMTPAMLAAKNQHFELLSRILDMPKFDVNKQGLDNRTILHWLAELSSVDDEVLDKLWKSNVNVNIIDSKGVTPLLLASISKNVAMLFGLLNKNAIVDIQDQRCRAALHYVCEAGLESVQVMILNKHANTSLADKEGYTPLLIACKQNKIGCINELIEYKTNVNFVDNFGVSALHWVAGAGLFDIALLLIDKGADVNCKDADGKTPLLSAACNSHWNVVDILIKAGSIVNFDTMDGRTPLSYACEKGHLQTVELLLEKGANPNPKENECFPLKLALYNGFDKIASLLLEYGADFTRTDTNGRVPLHWAASNDMVDIVSTLINLGADACVVDNIMDTPLTLATWNQNLQVMKVLLQYSNLGHAEADEGFTALHLAIINDFFEGVRILLQAGSQVSWRDKNKNTVLISSCMFDTSYETFKLLLQKEHLQFVDINATGLKNRTALHWAVGCPKFTKALIEAGADINAIDCNGASPLLLAIAHKQPESAKLLIENQANVNLELKDGRKSIHHACVYNQPETLEILLKLNVNVNELTKDGRTPLLIACIEGHCEIVNLLVKYGANINEVYFQSITPLSIATDNKHHSTMKALLNAGADPNLAGSKRYGSLITSIINTDAYGLATLIQNNAQLDTILYMNDNFQAHPLLIAAVKRNDAAMLTVVEYMTDMNHLKQLLREGSLYYFIKDDQIIDCVRLLAITPRSLKRIVRKYIRDILRFPILSKIEELNLPITTKDFLMMKEIWSFTSLSIADMNLK